MSKIHAGIILKTYFPRKCKIAVLDSHLGKIIGVPMRDNLCRGALIQYTIRPQYYCSFLHEIEVIDVPFAFAHHDIIFLHQVLELCYYFIPVESSGMSGIFNLINYLYAIYKNGWSAYTKKLFLFKLLTEIGVYPEQKEFQSPYFLQLASLSIELLEESYKETVGSEMHIDRWLKQCMAIHPLVKKFNTIHFLDSDRNL